MINRSFNLVAELLDSENSHSEALNTQFGDLKELGCSDKKKFALEKICLLQQSSAPADVAVYDALVVICIELGLPDIAEVFCIRSLLCSPKRWWAINQLKKILTGSAGISVADTQALNNREIPESLFERYFPTHTTRYVGAENYDNTVTRRVAYPATEHQLTAPIGLNDYKFRAYSHSSLTSREAFSLEISNGRLWFDGFNFVAWDSQGNVIPEVSTGNCQVVDIVASTRKPKKITGSVSLLGNRIAGNYYHWLYDVIPRLAVLEKCGLDRNEINKFILTPVNKKFQRETLAHFSIGDDRIHNIGSDGVYIEADTLIMPSYGSNEFLVRDNCAPGDNLHSFQGAWASEFLKKEFLGSGVPASGDKSQSGGDAERRPIYVRRGDEQGRAVVQEELIVEYFRSKNFDIVDPAEHSVKAQAQLFSRASVVVAAHGAALTNAVFCKAGTRVIELHGPFTASCFWIVSDYMGLDHYTYLAESTVPRIKALHGQELYSSLESCRLVPVEITLSELDTLLQSINEPDQATLHAA